jgi:thiol-disulfide isomerase/thioredoxin
VSRRAWLVAGAGVAAAAAGVGWQAWRAAQLADDGGGLWTMRFPRPEGGELVMAELRGRPLLLNFWATWCPPCLQEMPELDRFQRQFGARGWQVVGLAVDGPTPVRDYLRRLPVGFPIGLAGFEGAALSQRLGNPQSALPFTAIFDVAGRTVHRKLGQTSREELARWAESA